MNLLEIYEKYATSMDVPNPFIKNRVWMAKTLKDENWYIMTSHGPTWFWNAEKNAWVISIGLDSRDHGTLYNTMEEAFHVAMSINQNTLGEIL